MEETNDKLLINHDLQTYFKELQQYSLKYKLGQSNNVTSGDDTQNPLNKQFGIILAKIEEMLGQRNKDADNYLKLLSMKASIIYEKAKILCTENLLSQSESLLEEAMDLVKEYAQHPKVAFLYLRIANHLSYVLSRKGSLEMAKNLLLNTLENHKKCDPEVFSTDDLFLNNKKTAEYCKGKLYKLEINNMQMLSWIYTRLGINVENLTLQHNILQKQLDYPIDDFSRYAESCFKLAGMFISNEDWLNAVYHLEVAESMLNSLEVTLVPNAEIYGIEAEIARCWVYYGLQLFETSRKIKIAQKSSEAELLTNEAIKSEDSIMLFQGIDVEIPKNIPTTPIESLEQAKKLFAQSQKWIKRARVFYTLRDYPLQYVNLCLDLSELYRYLSFYEEDLDAQYAVQKRRYDSLETLRNILKEVRPNCYVAVNFELTKELVEVQMELMNLNLQKIYTPKNDLKGETKEDILKRQMNSLSSVQKNMEKVSTTLNNTNLIEIGEINAEIVEPHDGDVLNTKSPVQE